MNHAFKTSLKDVVQVLNSHSVSFMITGGLAQNQFVKSRLIDDIDIVFSLETERLESFLKSLSDYFSFRDANKKIQIAGLFNLTHKLTNVKVDLIMQKETSHAKIEFARKVSQDILGEILPCVSKEDLILSKLKWMQVYRSKKQINDIKLLMKCRYIDTEYLLSWFDINSIMRDII